MSISSKNTAILSLLKKQVEADRWYFQALDLGIELPQVATVDMIDEIMSLAGLPEEDDSPDHSFSRDWWHERWNDVLDDITQLPIDVWLHEVIVAAKAAEKSNK